MCGIAGYFGKDLLNKERILSTLKSMQHRGPDAGSYFQESFNASSITLLHTRLAILDLEQRSNQPYYYNNLVMVFNGEVYNYIEIRRELQSLGHVFDTNSDTEVVLKAYSTWGSACLARFEGMWSLAIFNTDTKELFIARDRFGEKPLFVYNGNDYIAFASEVKFLRELLETEFTVDLGYLKNFIVLGHRVLYKSNRTWYNEVKRFSQASFALINTSYKIEEKKYWEISNSIKTEENLGHDFLVNKLREMIIKSVEIRLRSDVPLAFCLSGGIDSGSLASIASKIFGLKVEAFSIIDQDERYNESSNIALTAEDINCNLNMISLDYSGFLSYLTDLIKQHDGPLVTISYYVHALLSKSISKSGFKIAISGTGADEIFTGYYDHFIWQICDLKNSELYNEKVHDFEKHILPYINNPDIRDWKSFLRAPNYNKHLHSNSNYYESLLNNREEFLFTDELLSQDSKLKNRMLNELFHEIVPPILHSDDHNSMKYSIENRSPFLDTKLCEFMYSLSSGLLIRNGYGKYLLREAMQGILNDHVRLSRKKVGFNASINSLFDIRSKENQNWLFSSSPIFEIFSKEKVREYLLGSDKSYSNADSKFLFNLINAKIFLEML